MAPCRLPSQNSYATIRRMIDDKNDTVDHMNPNNIVVVVVTFELWRHIGVSTPQNSVVDDDDVAVNEDDAVDVLS